MTLKYLGREIEKILFKGNELSKIMLQNRTLFDTSPSSDGGLMHLSFNGTTADSGPLKLPVTGTASGYRTGKIGQALSGTIGNLTVSGFEIGTKWTLHFWAFIGGGMGRVQLFNFGQLRFEAYPAQGQYLLITSSYGAGGGVWTTAGRTDKWTHIALTCNGLDGRIFFDGKYESAINFIIPITASSLIINSNAGLDELCLSEEILWTADFTPPDENYYRSNFL